MQRGFTCVRNEDSDVDTTNSFVPTKVRRETTHFEYIVHDR